MIVPMVDVIFADVAQPDQARIVGHNAEFFLKTGGHYVISIKASCIDSTVAAEAVFAREVKKLQVCNGESEKDSHTMDEAFVCCLAFQASVDDYLYAFPACVRSLLFFALRLFFFWFSRLFFFPDWAVMMCCSRKIREWRGSWGGWSICTFAHVYRS